MPIRFACPDCGKRYQVKDELAGKKAKCQACGKRLLIPRPKPRQAKPAPVTPPENALRPESAPSPDNTLPSDSMGSLFDEEFSVAETTKKPATLCPSCQTPLPEDGWLCVACGLNLRTGEVMETAHEDDDAIEHSSRSDRSATWLSSYIRRCVFSAIGALLGAGLWAAVAIGTGFEMSIIAIGVGVAAGVGMLIGADDETGPVAGIPAALFALAGVIMAKIFIFNYIVAVVAFSIDSLEFRRGLASAAYAAELMKERGIDPNSTPDVVLESVYSEAEREAAGWDEAEIDRRMDALGATIQEALAAEPLADEAGDEPVGIGEADGVGQEDGFGEGAGDGEEAFAMEQGPPAGQGSLVGLFFENMFGPLDILFVFFAVGTAFRIGMGW